MNPARIGMRLAAVCLASWAAGCAPLPPAPGSVTAPPSASSPPGSPTQPPVLARPARPSSVVPRDSTPPAEALGVLGTIPEPLRPGEQVDAVRTSSPGTVPDVLGDTTAVSSPAADVPVPEPTAVLGERRPIAVDSTLAPSGHTGATPPPAPHPALAAPADTCWRVQLLAPLDPAAAEQARATATSLMLVPLVIEQEQGRYKVRTRDCLTHTAADLLRRRAIESGFTQAFRISSVKP